MSAADIHQHSHSHPHHHHEAAGDNAIGLGWAVVVTLAFAAVEGATGIISGSLALLSDAGHMLTDSISLVLAAIAAHLARRPPSMQHSYGFARAEVLAAMLNALFMLGIVTWIASEAFARLVTPRHVAGEAVTVVALIGLMVNIIVAWLLTRGSATLNKRAALVHVMGDALGSVAALASGLIILFSGWMLIDPILSMVVALLILFSTLNLLRETVHVLMEAVPRHLDLSDIGLRLAGIRGVARVHDLHVWALTSGQIAISAHLNVHDLALWPRILEDARNILRHDFGIGHVTLQPEVDQQSPLTFHHRHE
jgi:cobalt-zinc-cadmium efflux system protein